MMSAPALNVKKPAGGPASSGGAPRKIVRGENLTAPAGVAQHYPDSHPSRILSALLAGQKLTAASAWRDFGCMRLAAVVRVLRRDGWPVETQTVAVKTSHGRTAHVAEYAMGGRP